MALLRGHIDFYREIFSIPGFVTDPFMMFGFQEIMGDHYPKDFDYPDLKALLLERGISDLTVVDFFDERADWHFDFNKPVPESYHGKFKTVADIGCLEHLFDVPQCLKNCMNLVEPGGIYFLHTPVHGGLYHGFYTFNPDMLIQAFKLNGFEILYLKYSTFWGAPLNHPGEAKNSLIWIVGRKIAEVKEFVAPQQDLWEDLNKTMAKGKQQGTGYVRRWPKLEYWFHDWTPPALAKIARRLLRGG